MTDTEADPATALLDATVMHVPFDGWSETAFKAAIEDTGVDPTVARGLYPRGAIDLAAAFHRKGDDLMIAAYGKEDTDTLRFREKVALMVRLRLEAVEDKEAVRRGATLFALPMHAAGQQIDLGHRRPHLDRARGYVAGHQLVHEAGNALGRVFLDRALLAWRRFA